MTISITVEGTARPQGSKKHVGKGRMVESSKYVAQWREWVRMKAVQAMRGKKMLMGPVALTVSFGFDRPKTHSTSKGLRPTAPKWHTSKPDTDKLLRAILDALTGVVFKDDSQVCHVTAAKPYVDAAQTFILIQECEL